MSLTYSTMTPEKARELATRMRLGENLVYRNNLPLVCDPRTWTGQVIEGPVGWRWNTRRLLLSRDAVLVELDKIGGLQPGW
jgi:hypothetical protein